MPTDLTGAATGGSPSPLDQRPPPGEPGRLCDWMQRRYIRNGRDDALTDALAEILDVEGGQLLASPALVGATREARGLVVTAESGAGKSVLLQRNLARLAGPPRSDDLPSKVLMVTARPEATLKSLAHELCALTGYPALQPKVTTWKAFDLARHRFQALGIGVLCLDEAHHFLVARRNGDPSSDVLRAFKSLLQGVGAVALILSGVPVLEDMIRRDSETSRRFGHLRLGPIADKAGRDLLVRSIAAYCQWAELEPVADPSLPDRLLHATGSSFGRSVETTIGAVRHALLAGRRALVLDDFARVFDRGAHPDDVNPFVVADWARDGSRLPPPRRSAP